MTHVEEVIQLTDMDRYPAEMAGDANTFKRACLNNLKNRYLHHHVFNFKLLEQVVSHCGLREVDRVALDPYHLVFIAHKV